VVKLSLSYRFDLAPRALLQTTGFNKRGRRHGLVILHSALRHRGLWGSLLLLAVFSGIAAPVAYARARHSDAWAREHYAAAERIREALNGRPPADRTHHDYQRVLNAYRSIYLGAPASSKADPSVVAVAETLVEMGRLFDDDKILNKAIDQYKYLRREYPGSKYRCDGLFTIGEIYKDDLNDPEAARVTFQDFLHRYPRNRLADDARQAIAELDQQSAVAKPSEAKKSEAREVESAPPAKKNKNKGAAEVAAESPDPGAEADKGEPSPLRSGRLPRVTGIRHWSTPDYTRVAIDLESDVKFSSQRIATPARIFFDLRDTKLASPLVGKSFDVDDGFLKKIRVAQFAPGRTRVVLEVDNLADYNAFLLPNPYRLIIDIHGKDIHGKNRAAKRHEVDESLLAEADVMSAPQAGPASESDHNLPNLPAESAVLDAAGASAHAEADDNPAPSKETLANTTSPAIVKKIVEADDDATVTPVGPLKLGRPHSKAVAHKKLLPTDYESDTDASGSSASGTSQSDLADSRPAGGSHKPSSSRRATDLGVREARPTAAGDRSLIRALGLKIGKIVIDPGHGGHDTGTIGPNGLEEKDLVLEVGRRLGKLLETRLGAEVVYTRKDDTFIPLETRTAIANQARADLFVSIHANSSHDAAARGVETYYLNFTSSPEALEVAARENAVSEQSIYQLQDLVKKIALKEKIEESREFAWDVQQSLHSGLAVKSPAIRDRGVKKAPFIVLIGANMPSILAEISFVSNPTDEHRLATSEYRQRIAESLYRGIAKYVNGLSGVKVAGKMDKAAGQ
jgi:N-acetylmuramoyl-L-alanine amidase